MLFFSIFEATADDIRCDTEKPVQLPKEESYFGVKVETLLPKEVNEHRPPGWLFQKILEIVSFFARRSNLRKAEKIQKELRKKGKEVLLKKILWDMGRDPKHFSSIFVDRLSTLNHQSKVYAAGWRSLDIFYNFWEKYAEKATFLEKFWIGRMGNRQAVSNRKDMVVEMLCHRLSCFSIGEEIRIVSLASGSAQSIIELIKKTRMVNIRVKLIDGDKTALNAAKKQVISAGFIDMFEFHYAKITQRTVRRYCKDFQPHIVEMVGLADYFTDAWMTRITAEVKKHLVRGGTFLTCNINFNPEKPFLDWSLLWPMTYRSPEQLACVMLDGWFGKDSQIFPSKIRIIYESFKIHGIVICVK